MILLVTSRHNPFDRARPNLTRVSGLAFVMETVPAMKGWFEYHIGKDSDR